MGPSDELTPYILVALNQFVERNIRGVHRQMNQCRNQINLVPSVGPSIITTQTSTRFLGYIGLQHRINRWSSVQSPDQSVGVSIITSEGFIEVWCEKVALEELMVSIVQPSEQ
jgi:hypothetical protein